MLTIIRVIKTMMFLLVAFVMITLKSQNVVVYGEVQFDPYSMNGGLITAIAGPNYYIIATDTRMIGNSRYNLLSRHEHTSRLWGIQSSTVSSSNLMSHQKQEEGHLKEQKKPLFAPDGSFNMDASSKINSYCDSSSSTSRKSSESTTKGLRLLYESDDDFNVNETNYRSNQSVSPPIIIGSVGCQVDCDALKRTIRSELRTATYFGDIRPVHATTTVVAGATTFKTIILPIDSVVVLLSQILYSRRNFPYGCYCVVSGFACRENHNNDGGALLQPQVYIYDAIGSYEQVAIACTGTGFELLQPILDQQFHPPMIPIQQSSCNSNNSNLDNSSNPIDTSAYLKKKQGRNLVSVVPKHVNCSNIQDAIHILINAYRSVSEREIGVGDHLFIYTVQQQQQRRRNIKTTNDVVTSTSSNDNNTADSNDQTTIFFQSRIWTAPLKKH